jgi:hypothetical protein
MKTRDIGLVTGTLACMLAIPVLAQGSKDWVDIKSPDELRALYSNKTFTGEVFRPAGRISFVGYYRADGSGVLVVNGQRIPRTWAVKGDEVCVTDSRATNCLRFQRNKAQRNQIIGLQGGQNTWAIWFTVKDGVPKF